MAENCFSRIFVLSPHYDDAVFSIGMFMIKFCKKIILVDVFTGYSEQINSSKLVKNTIIEDCNLSCFAREDIKKWNDIRTSENQYVVSELKLQHIDFRIMDAIFRGEHNCFYKSEFDLFQNHNRSDIKQTFTKLEASFYHNVKPIINKESDLVLVPIATGGHIDHKIVNLLGKRKLEEGYRVLFYDDFPYCISSNSNEYSVAIEYTFTMEDIKSRIKLMSLYKSQIQGIFGGIDKLKQLTYDYFEKNELKERLWKIK